MKNEALKVSIIIPVYNSKLTIIDCLGSVLSQNYKEYEIIIIDDGSNDGSADIITAYLMSYSGFYKLIKQANSGPSAARNTGIRNAKYDTIAFLDSDDIWAPWHLSDLLRYYVEYPEYPIISCTKGDFSKKPGYAIINFKKMLYKCYIYSSCMIIRKNIIEKYYFSESQKYSEDYGLWLDIASSGYNFLVLAQCSARPNPQKRTHNIRGLSGNIWQMEYGELSNYKHLLDRQKIIMVHYIIICTFSFLKYINRIICTIFQARD
jgi:glycosyltransferase involved in cell wall biosynthesis